MKGEGGSKISENQGIKWPRKGGGGVKNSFEFVQMVCECPQTRLCEHFYFISIIVKGSIVGSRSENLGPKVI